MYNYKDVLEDKMDASFKGSNSNNEREKSSFLYILFFKLFKIQKYIIKLKWQKGRKEMQEGEWRIIFDTERNICSTIISV